MGNSHNLYHMSFVSQCIIRVAALLLSPLLLPKCPPAAPRPPPHRLVLSYVAGRINGGLLSGVVSRLRHFVVGLMMMSAFE